jgi:hypothetical protein
MSVVTNLIYARGEAKDQQLWIQTAHKMIEFFYKTSDVCTSPFEV